MTPEQQQAALIAADLMNPENGAMQLMHIDWPHLKQLADCYIAALDEIAAQRARADRAEARVRELEAAWDDLPHAEDCAYITSLWSSLAARPRTPVADCDCVKAKVKR